MAGVLVEALQGRSPHALTDAFQLDDDARREAARQFNATSVGGGDPIDYEATLKEIRAAGIAGLNNGLRPSENRRLFVSRSVEEIVALIRTGLWKRLAGDGA